MKIYLSPSDQTGNLYAYGGTTEAAQCRRFADAAQRALERCGFEVKNNQTFDMYARVAESNRWNSDLHVCIHTNAFDGTVSGTRMFAFNTTGSGYKAAQAIFRRLAPITPGSSENLTARPGLYEIKVSNAPCVYIEVDFHDNVEAAKWLISHPTEIGEAICQGICDHFGVAYAAPGGAEDAALRWAREKGLLDGLDENGAVTGAQLMRVLYRLHGNA